MPANSRLTVNIFNFVPAAMPPHAAALDVLYEDNHLLAVNKPALLPTMGVADDAPSLIALARVYLQTKYQKPGNAYVGVVSRLDAPVTGLTLLAKTSKAAARLTEAFRTRAVAKAYLAVVTPPIDPAAGELEHYLRHDERHRKVHVTHAGASGAQLARLAYETVGVRGQFALLRVAPETGRKHQIRVQLAKVGAPIVGDLKYGSREAFAPGIALHSFALELEHPVRHEPLRIEAPPPRSWTGHRAIGALLRELA
jgi:23S rRNA pseudouridine1911/1915/1917 synthase